MSQKIPQDHIDHIDRLYFDPNERATGVHQIFRQALEDYREEYGEEAAPKNWDLVCWAIEFLGQQSLVMNDGNFIALTKSLAHWLYSMHYSNATELYGKPDKESGNYADVRTDHGDEAGQDREAPEAEPQGSDQQGDSGGA